VILAVAAALVLIISVSTSTTANATTNEDFIKKILQLKMIANALTFLDQKLEFLLQPAGPPTEPVPDKIRIELEKIKSEAQSIISRVDEELFQVFFEENFDGVLSGWSLSQCSIFSGQTCLDLQQRTSGVAGTPPPSSPNWGFVGVNDFVAGCNGAIQTKVAKTFTVSTEDDYNVSTTLGATGCDICTVSAQLFTDGALVLDAQGTTLSPFTPRPASQLKQATVHLTAGSHTIEIGMHSNLACNGEFGAYFDDIKVESAGSQASASIAQVQSSSPPSGPHFSLELGQTSANTIRPDSVVMPLQVNWFEGYKAEPVSVYVIGINATGITHSVTSTYSSTNSQMFDIVFDVPAGAQTGEYLFLIYVKEIESEDMVDATVTLNVD